MSGPDKNAQAYFNLFSKAEAQLPLYPRGTACYTRAQHAARLMKHHGRDIELIWALGTINNFIPNIPSSPNFDWGNGMAFHVAVRDKATNLVYDQAFFHEPVSQEQWGNTFIPIRADGIRPRIERSDINMFPRLKDGEPKLLDCTANEALEIAGKLYLKTVRNHKPTIIDRLGSGNQPIPMPD